MAAQHNVVAFNSGENSETFVNSKQAEKLLNTAGQLASSHLKKLLQYMFDNVDHHFVGQLDQAENSALQSSYLAGINEINLKKELVIKSFYERFIHSFNSTQHKKITEKKLPLENRVLDELFLIEDDELEESLAITNMVSKGNNLFKEAIYAVEQRLCYLIGIVDISRETSPLGPNVICNAFKDSIQLLNVDLKVKLIIYKLFDKYVIRNLHDLYDGINSELAKAGILPHIKYKIAKNPDKTSTKSKPPKFIRDFDFENLSKEEVVEKINNILAQNAKNINGVKTTNSSEQQDILAALSVLQKNTGAFQNDVARIGDGANKHATNVIGQVGKILEDAHNNSAFLLDSNASNTLDLVRQMFDYILDDHILLDSMKALIARLQIPILKVAFMDKSFFSEKEHPARLLLNEITDVGIGWDEDQNRGSDPLYAKVEYTVDRILTEFDDDLNIFPDLLAGFVSLKENQKYSNQIDHRKEDIDKLVQQVLQSRLSSFEVPINISDFLNHGWKEVLTKIYSKNGEQSSTWNNALRTTDDLMWSVQPKNCEVERCKLISSLPGLIARLKNALDMISYSSVRREELLDSLLSIHLSTIKAQRQSEISRLNVVQNKKVQQLPATPISSEIKIKQLPVLSKSDELQQPKEEQIPDVEQILADIDEVDNDTFCEEWEKWNDEYAAKVKEMDVGTWVELTKENGKKARCRLVWKSDLMGEYTFADRKYRIVADKTFKELASDFYQGKIKIIQDIPLIDRAIEAVIKGLTR